MAECWMWGGAVDKDGYGITSVNGKTWKVHRLVYWLTNDVLTSIVRHSCDTPGCYNPEHLLGGTVTDNNRDTVERGRHANQYKDAAHCVHGHAFTPENTKFKANGSRECRECKRIANREWKRRKHHSNVLAIC